LAGKAALAAASGTGCLGTLRTPPCPAEFPLSTAACGHRLPSAPAARRAPATPLERRRPQRRAGSAAPGAASSDDCAWLGAGWPGRRRSRSASASGRAGGSGAGSAGASSDSAGSCARARRAAPAAPAAPAGPAPPPGSGAGARLGCAMTCPPATAFRAALLLGGGAGGPGVSDDGGAAGAAAAGAPASVCVAGLLASLFAERRQLRAALADLDAFCRSEGAGPALTLAGSRAAAAPTCTDAALCSSEDRTHPALPTLQQGAVAQLPAQQAQAGMCPAGAPALPAASPTMGPPAAPVAGGGGVHSHARMTAGPEPGPAPWADALRWPLARLEAETASVSRCGARAPLCDSACPSCLYRYEKVACHQPAAQLWPAGSTAADPCVLMVRMHIERCDRAARHVRRQCQGMGCVALRLHAALRAK